MFEWNIIILLLGVFLLVTAMFNRPSVVYLVIAALVFGSYFWIISSNLLLFLVFALGILLIIIELYIPDFGVIGLLGFGAVIFTLMSIYQDMTMLLLVLLSVLFVGVITGVIYLKVGRNLVLSPGFVLNEAITEDHAAERIQNKNALVGKVGKALTVLRPVGKAVFNGQHYEVISDEDFIAAGTEIVVVYVRGTQVYVRKVGN